jgi:hypothetical protein
MQDHHLGSHDQNGIAERVALVGISTLNVETILQLRKPIVARKAEDVGVPHSHSFGGDVNVGVPPKRVSLDVYAVFTTESVHCLQV